MSIFDPDTIAEACQINRMVVRKKTSFWKDGGGIHSRISLTILKRKSCGYMVAYEDCDNIGADEVFPRFTNINSVKDGIYEVDTCNEQRDWETGCIDDYDYKLIPYIEKGENTK